MPAHNLIGFDGTVKLLDCGVATIFGQSSALTSRKIRLHDAGSCEEGAVDHRSDLFSLGIGLYGSGRKAAFQSEQSV